MENSCLNSYSVEKAICNMYLSVLQELGDLPEARLRRISGVYSHAMMEFPLEVMSMRNKRNDFNNVNC